MADEKKIAIVLGTRPEIIKLSPIIRECQRRDVPFFLIHSEQHHLYEMDQVFFEDLELPTPRYRLGVGADLHGRQTGRLLERIEKVLIDERPSIVLVQGDTNTVLGGALAATKLHIPVGHVEAGLRSYDRRMPEELNRILADHCSAVLFAPTPRARDILLGEGVPNDQVHITGNTIVDAVHQNLRIARKKSDPLAKHHLQPQGYIVVTAHRPENVDRPDRLQSLLEAIDLVQRELSLPLVYPLHPRTQSKVHDFGFSIPQGIRLVSPLGFLEFLRLEADAALILTDSGGMQEEACILKVPCVTLRENTERPETLEVGANILAGIAPARVLSAVQQMLSTDGEWPNPFGDGTSGELIVDLVVSSIALRGG